MTKTPAQQIVEKIKRLYDNAMTSTSGGNLSIRCDDGIYITPSAIDKGSLTVDDIIRVKPDGTVEGKHVPSIEHRFHLAIYAARPDVSAIVHAHSPSLVAYAASHTVPDTSILPQAVSICGETGLIPYAVPGSQKLCDYVAAVFSTGVSCAVMANHGAISAAGDMDAAFRMFELFDRTAQIETCARILGGANALSQKHLTVHRLKSTPPAAEYNAAAPDESEGVIRETLAAFVRRAHKMKLITAYEGAFSMKLPDGSFVITPKNSDRGDISADAMVRVTGNKAERGKEPSNSYPLHTVLYEKNPDWNSIMIAEPVHIMAYAVSDAAYNIHAMSESEMILRAVPKYPFGSTFMQPLLLAAEMDETHPVAIIENDCVISGGKTALSAYDRLEVIEYGARSLIEAAAAGLKTERIQ